MAAPDESQWDEYQGRRSHLAPSRGIPASSGSSARKEQDGHPAEIRHPPHPPHHPHRHYHHHCLIIIKKVNLRLTIKVKRAVASSKEIAVAGTPARINFCSK